MDPRQVTGMDPRQMAELHRGRARRHYEDGQIKDAVIELEQAISNDGRDDE